MTEVVIHRPGHSAPYTYHNPDTGLDEERTEWTFNATVNGRLGLISGIFETSVSEDRAAYWIRQNLLQHPGQLEGILSGSSEGNGGSDSAGSERGNKLVWELVDDNSSTDDGSDGGPPTDGSRTDSGIGGAGGGGTGGEPGPGRSGVNGGVHGSIVEPPKKKTADGT